MQAIDDMALLREFAERHSEAAFEELVNRRIGFVYSAALRQVREPLLAEEITQAVFILLAQKAAKIPGKTILTGWLFKTTHFTALAQIRAAAKRSLRMATIEKELQMQTEFQSAAADEIWNQMSPLLDEALAALGEKDRQAVLLRLFENKSLAEVGSSLGIGEDTARKRVSRALEKLHRYFNRRGISSTTTIIAGEISANSVQVVPATLTKTVTAVAVAKGAAASTSTLTLIKGALKLMAWTKAKTAILVGATVLLVVGTAATGSKRLWFANDEICFEAEGTVTYATAPDPRGSYTDIKHFVVMRDGNLWKIRTVTEKQERTGRGGPIGASVDSYYEMGFDGKNIFALKQQDKNKILATVPANERGKWVFAEGDVEKADSPPCNDIYNLYPVWLAYCSAPYFKNLMGDKVVSPAFATKNFIGDPITKMESPAKWNVYDKFFIKDVSWLSDGTYGATTADGKEMIQKYQPPYDVPFVWGRFENLSWTNWNGISVPTTFKITVYRPDYTSKTSANLTVAYTITGALDQIRKIGRFSPVPKLTTPTSITDWRKNGRGGPGRYLTTNSWDYSDVLGQKPK